MQRVAIFLFLTILVPAGIFWASHDFEPPGAALNRFVGEVHALTRKHPAPEPTQAPEPESEPEPKPEPKQDPEQDKPKIPTPKDDPKPKPKQDPVPKPPEKSPYELAQDLFSDGKFQQAAAAFTNLDERQRALALLGQAFRDAFPRNLPDAPYYVVTSSSGNEFEGFGTEKDGSLTLVSPGGRQLSLTLSVISSKRRVERPKAMDRLAKRIAVEGVSRSLQGTRLFALLHEAFAMDRPDVAAPLLERVLELDEQKPFFLSAVRQRVALEFQDDMYRAFARCQIAPEDEAPEPVVTNAPRKLGNGVKPVRPRRKPRSTIKDDKARELVQKAAPHRIEGRKLHTKVHQAGLKGAKIADIETAIRELETAMGYYEKALEREDSNEIHALNRHCSKLAFALRFWKEQIQGR